MVERLRLVVTLDQSNLGVQIVSNVHKLLDVGIEN